MIINIQDDILRIHALGLLDGMLIDKTTKQHIMWATGAYASLGGRYEYNGEITPDLITGEHASVIKTRVRKAMEQQSARTRQHAEVFLPPLDVPDDERLCGRGVVWSKRGVFPRQDADGHGGVSQGQEMGALCRFPAAGDHLRRSPLSGQPV